MLFCNPQTNRYGSLEAATSGVASREPSKPWGLTSVWRPGSGGLAGAYWDGADSSLSFTGSLEGRTAPDVLLFHCGSNDLGKVKSIELGPHWWRGTCSTYTRPVSRDEAGVLPAHPESTVGCLLCLTNWYFADLEPLFDCAALVMPCLLLLWCAGGFSGID